MYANTCNQTVIKFFIKSCSLGLHSVSEIYPYSSTEVSFLSMADYYALCVYTRWYSLTNGYLDCFPALAYYN